MRKLARVYGGKINPNFYADGNLTPKGSALLEEMNIGGQRRIQKEEEQNRKIQIVHR